MANTSDISNGVCLQINNDVMQVVEFQHVKPGKGAAFVRTKLKSLTSGKVLAKTIPAGHKIDIVRVERRSFQFLYKDDMGYHLMNNETYNQVFLDEKLIDNADLLKEGETIEVLFHASENTPLTADMPMSVNLEVTYTEPGMKGDTATNTLKPATLETGAEINVPLFIDTGELIQVDTRTRAYMGRVKS